MWTNTAEVKHIGIVLIGTGEQTKRVFATNGKGAPMSRLIDINAVIRMLNTLDRYTSTELTLCDTDKTFPKNEVFIVDDVYEGLDGLPLAEPRKKGKWIFIHPLQADDEGAYICSNCHRGDWDIKPTDKYCKFCGMAMEIYATLLT